MSFYRIRPKSGTVTQWEQANTVLAEREIGYELSDDGLGKGLVRMKMGDGVTPWNELPYAQKDLTLLDGNGNDVIYANIPVQENMLLDPYFRCWFRGETKKPTVLKYYFCGKWRNREYTSSIDTPTFSRYGNAGLKITNNSNITQNIAVEQLFDVIGISINNFKNFSWGIIVQEVESGTVENCSVQLLNYNESTQTVVERIDFDIDTQIRTYTGTFKKLPANNKAGFLISCAIQPEKSVIIYYAKLEQGNIFTGIPFYNETEDLQQIQRNCVDLVGGRTDVKLGYGIAEKTNNIYIMVDVPATMRKIPTLVTELKENGLVLWDGTSSATLIQLTTSTVNLLKVYERSGTNKIQIQINLKSNLLTVGKFYQLLSYTNPVIFYLDANDYS